MKAPKDWTAVERAALRIALSDALAQKRMEHVTVLKRMYERFDLDRYHCAHCWRRVVKITLEPEQWEHLANVNIVESDYYDGHTPEPVRE